MKKIIYSMITALVVSLLMTACLKEDNVEYPAVTGTEMYMADVSGKDSLITEVFFGKKIKIVVYTDADMVSIWPGGIRTIMKMKNSTVDSVDMFDHPVLVKSDCYVDYGLVKAQGLATTLQEDGGWYASYTYPAAGEFDLTIVATNHGYDGPDLKRVVYEPGKVTVR
jgi:hypothetical protein